MSLDAGGKIFLDPTFFFTSLKKISLFSGATMYCTYFTPLWTSLTIKMITILNICLKVCQNIVSDKKRRGGEKKMKKKLNFEKQSHHPVVFKITKPQFNSLV